MTKLADLDPRWYDARGQSQAGFTFECPHCVGKENGSRLGVAVHHDGTNFDPDPDNPQQFEVGEHVWTIIGGDSFDNISLSPSVDASKHGHWHGFITNGEVA